MAMTEQEVTTPRIYVASLSDYNAGRLVGRWIDADQTADEIGGEVEAMLAAAGPGREEWAIHDFEGFGSWRLSEWESFARVSAVAAGIIEHGAAFSAWIDYDSSVLDETDDIGDRFLEAYAGTFSSLADWAEEFADETGMLAEVPESLRAYFDFDKWANDADLSGDVWTATVGGDVAVFWGNV